MIRRCEKCGYNIEEGEIICANCDEPINIESIIIAKPEKGGEDLTEFYANLTDREKISVAVQRAEELDEFVTSHKAGGSFEHSPEEIARKQRIAEEKKLLARKSMKRWILAFSIVIISGLAILIGLKDHYSRIESISTPKIYEGWIYYSNTADNNRLYKIKEDGTGKSLIANLSVDNFEIYHKKNGETVIYYSAPGFGIYRLNADSSTELLIETAAQYIYPKENGFYYIPDFNGLRILSFYDFDKKKIRKLSTRYVDNMIYTPDGILYRDKGVLGNIWRNIDGAETRVLPQKVLGFGISDKKLFYIDATKGNGLYSIDFAKVNQLDAKNAIMLVKEKCMSLVAADGWIYYTAGDNGTLYRIKENGTEAAQLIEAGVAHYAVSDGKVICYVKDKLVLYNIETKTIFKLD